MKLNEIVLVEETMQKAIKRLLKPSGSIAKVMGGDAAAASTMLAAKQSDPAHTFKGGSPMNDQMLKSLSASKAYDESTSDDHGLLKVIRMPGGAKIMVVGAGDDMFVLTSEHQMGQLVESKDEELVQK